MVREAEENAESDKSIRLNVEAKNQLESYLYSLSSSLEDKLKDKLEISEKESLSKLIKETLAWLDENPSVEKDAYDEKRKEVEAIANPIMTRLYSAGAPENTQMPPSDSNKPSGDSSGPTVEEVD